MADFEEGELYVCVEFDDGTSVYGVKDYSGVVNAADILDEIADFAEVAPKFAVYKLVLVAAVNRGEIEKETA